MAIEIAKQIPVAGGMAGGSADAAATLRRVCGAVGAGDRPATSWPQIGADIGADVPFALTGGTAVGTGRGERLSPVLARTPLHWVLALADEGLSTPAVFAELDRLRAESVRPAAGRAGRRDAVGAGQRRPGSGCRRARQRSAGCGHLAAAGAAPDAAGRDRGGRAGRPGVRIRTTVALLCADAESAGGVAAELAGSGTCRTVGWLRGPAPGARIVGRRLPVRH